MEFDLESLGTELLYAIIISGIVLIGLWFSNIAYDNGVPHYISRKIGHFTGGFAFFASFFIFSSAWWPIILSVLFGTALLVARLIRPVTFRGVGGSGREKRVLAEIWFAWVAVPVLCISWLWLEQPSVAVTCLLFMAWGDGITGLIRWRIYGRMIKGLWGSLAMLCICLIISWTFIKPAWIGVIGSIVAVITEWAFGDIGIFKWADDNWAIPILSVGTILGLMALTGNL